MSDLQSEAGAREGDRVKAVFVQALACPSEEAAIEMVSAACGSDELLRRTVVQLVRAHWQSDTLLDAADKFPTIANDPLQPGENLHGLLVERLIGEGGMGLVYLARQAAPLDRPVAIKVLKPGVDTREVLKRFRLEQRALAALSHPNVARILDGGQTAKGHPYFVLEYVNGQPLTSFCDAHGWSVRQRLRLWLEAAEAVVHAHQRGILHHDLKPSNMLVTRDGPAAQVKVIDFGLAQLTESSAEFSTVAVARAGLGTPRYMSPEQWGVIPHPVDTRSDVYSLGVTLKELLAGEETLGRVRNIPGERQGISAESATPAPSEVFSRLPPDCARAIAGRRGTDSRTLCRLLRGELDWIILRATAPLPEQRYPSVAEFANDVRCFLRGEAIAARPPSRIYRWRKAIARHRGAAAFLSLLVLSSVTVAAVSSRQSSIAQRAEQEARRMAHVAEQSRDHTQRLLYAADIRLAADAWQRGDALEARELLDRHAPPNIGGRHDEGLAAAVPPGLEWHFLDDRLTHSETVFRLDGTGLEGFAALSPHRCLLRVGERKLLLWDAQTGTASSLNQVADLTGWGSLAASNDGRWLAIGSDCGELCLVDFQSQPTAVHRLRLAGERLHSLAFDTTAARLFLGTERDVIVYDVAAREIVGRLQRHQDNVNALAASRGRSLLAVASDDHYSSLWDTNKSQLLHLSPRAKYRLTAVVICPMGRFWIDADVKGNLRRFSADDGQLSGEWRLPSAVDCMTLSPDRTRLAVGCRSGVLHVLELADSAVKAPSSASVSSSWQQLAAHDARITGIAWPGIDTILTCGRDGQLVKTVLSLPLEQRVDELFGEFRLSVSPDGRWLGCQSPSRSWVVDIRHKSLQELPRDAGDCRWSQIAFHPSGGEMLIASTNGWIERWEVPRSETGSWQLKSRDRLLPPMDVACLRFSADGSRTVFASRTEDVLRVYSNATQNCLLEVSFADANQAALSPNGKWLATSYQRDLLLYEVDTGLLRHRSVGHHGETITDLAFTPDGRFVVTTSDDRTIRQWDTQAREPAHIVGVHPNGVPRSLSISSDGRTAITSSIQGQVWAWSLDVGQKLMCLTSCESGYRQSELSANDSVLALRDGNDRLSWLVLKKPREK